LLSYLLHPNPHIYLRIQDFKNKHFTSNTTMIGVQIRMGDGKNDMRMDDDKLDTLFGCGMNISKEMERRESGKKIKYFLTYDRIVGFEKAQKYFGEENVVHFPGVLVHTDKVYGKSKAAILASAEKNVIDYWLFGECDYHVITQSNFGRISSYRAGKKPQAFNEFMLRPGRCSTAPPKDIYFPFRFPRGCNNQGRDSWIVCENR